MRVLRRDKVDEPKEYSGGAGSTPFDGSLADTRLAAGGQRFANRKALIDHVRSLPAGRTGSLLAIFLDAHFNLLAADCLGQANAADCQLKPYLLVKRGLELGAVGFVLVHHAPERVGKATTAEVDVTREIRRAGEDFEVHLLDHLILTNKRCDVIS